MSGHRHNSNAGTQNQGNSLGDRACVRQSKLYRTHESGNDVKCILGTANLCWNADQQEGAYKGQQVFDHMAPNGVSNELRARSNEMKRNFATEYTNDWSTESGSYKSKAAASSYRVNDENSLVRTNPNSSRMATGRAAIATGNMGGMSLAQFQSDANAFSQPAPAMARSGRGSSNSEGFAAAMVQPERDYNFRANPSARNGAPQSYKYENNIYGHEDAAPVNRSSRGSQPAQTYKQSTAPYAADDHQYQFQQSQYRAQYQQPAADAYDYAPAQRQQAQYAPQYPPQQQQARGGASGRNGSYGYGQEDEEDAYAVPGIAAEGAGNREGRSTRPW